MRNNVLLSNIFFSSRDLITVLKNLFVSVNLVKYNIYILFNIMYGYTLYYNVVDFLSTPLSITLYCHY